MPVDGSRGSGPDPGLEKSRPAGANLGGLERRIRTLSLPRGPHCQEPELGRDHHPFSFTVFLAGGGIKSGVTYGSSDELGFDVGENPVALHDLQATILYLVGLEHTRYTYRFQGRDFRLTDVAGKVVSEILA